MEFKDFFESSSKDEYPESGNLAAESGNLAAESGNLATESGNLVFSIFVSAVVVGFALIVAVVEIAVVAVTAVGATDVTVGS